MQVRLQKYMASCGVAARRKCETLIRQGRVSVNGHVITELGTRIDPDKDIVSLDGKLLSPPPDFVYYALNKPIGVVVTASDSHGLPTVLQLLSNIPERIFPVGRLDRDTEGLLLLTNDGELANRLMHPRYHLEKEYLVTVAREVDEHNLRWLRKGIMIDGKRTLRAQIQCVRRSRGFVRYRVVIREGRKRQLRRMFKSVGHPVVALKRVVIGPIRLGRLHTGDFRHLTQKEIRNLKRATGLLKKMGGRK